MHNGIIKLKNTSEYQLDVHEFIEVFNFLIDNIFIEVGSVVFQQVIGIPMGTDCAPFPQI